MPNLAHLIAHLTKVCTARGPRRPQRRIEGARTGAEQDHVVQPLREERGQHFGEYARLVRTACPRTRNHDRGGTVPVTSKVVAFCLWSMHRALCILVS